MTVRALTPPMVSLRLALEARAGQPLPEWETMAASLRSVRLAAGEVVFNEGEHHPYIYIVQRGVVELSSRDDRGRRIVVDFGTEGQTVADLRGLGVSMVKDAVERGLDLPTTRVTDGLEGRAMRTMRAVEPAQLAALDTRVLEDLCRRHAAWGMLAVSMLLNYALRLEVREFERRALPPEERYLLLLTERPDLVSRIKQKDLALSLDLTEVAMSRLLARVRTRAATEAHGG